MLERVWRKGNPLHFWWECKLIQPLGRTLWRFLKKTRNKTTIWWSSPATGHIPWETTIQKDTSTHLNICCSTIYNQIRSDQSLSRVQLFATPWIAARQASLSNTNSWSSLRLGSIESTMPSSHLILCRPLLLLPPIPPSIRVFSNEPGHKSNLDVQWQMNG